MKSTAKLIFKGIEKREGGEFVNDKGQKIKYDGSYVLKADEQTDNGIYERRFKIPLTNVALIESLKLKKAYDELTINFDIQMYGNNVRIVPIGLADSNNK